MKLRNKKTGEIGKLHCDMNVSPAKYGVFEDTDIRGHYWEYNTLAKLNEEWEDYEEPKGSALDLTILTLTNFIENEPDEDKVDLDDCKQLLEKLKAWKRLKDKGFEFYPVDRYEALGGNGFDIPITATMPPEAYTDVGVSKDLDILFGGEE